MADVMTRPAITKVSPDKVTASGGRQVVIKGTGFSGLKAVHFGDFPALAILNASDTAATVLTPPSYPSVVPVTVEATGGVSPPSTVTFVTGKGRTPIFILEMIYLVILLAVGALYFTSVNPIHISFGPVPVGVPWFAALGAVVIGLQGVIDHGADWDESYNFWHVARPFTGVTFGVIAYLTIVAGILATGTTQPKTGSASKPTDDIIYYLVAFVVGYREEIFRNLVKRIGDVIFTPGP